VIDTLAGNFIKNMKISGTGQHKAKTTLSFLMKILALNLIQGLIEIADHYQNDLWADENIQFSIIQA